MQHCECKRGNKTCQVHNILYDMKIFRMLINALSHLLYILFTETDHIWNRQIMRYVYHEVLIISVVFPAKLMSMERNVSIPTICLVVSRLPAGKRLRAGRASDLCILTSFWLVRTGCLHSGDPRGATSCLWFWFPSTLAAAPIPLQNASLQMQIASRTHFSVLRAARAGKGKPCAGRIITIEKLNEIYVARVRRIVSL